MRLGDGEPRMDRPRELRVEHIPVHHLLYGVTSDHPVVTMQVPYASSVVEVARSETRAACVDVCYECTPSTGGEERVIDLELHAVEPGNEIPLHGRLLGTFVFQSTLIALYAKRVM